MFQLDAKAIDRQLNIDMDGNPIPPHIAKRYNGTAIKREIKLREFTDEERAQLETLYDHVIVSDYGDSYHLSEEEKKTQFQYYEVFSKLLRRKRKYRKLNEFIETFRMCMDALEVVANDNIVYPHDKFVKMVLRGEIKIVGLNFPKYTGKDRKFVNWELVSEYVTDRDLDPMDFMKKEESVLDDIDDEDLLHRLFTDEEIQMLTDAAQEIGEEHYYYPGIGAEEDPTEIETASKKAVKALSKDNPIFIQVIKDAEKEERRSQEMSRRLSSFVFDMTEDDLKAIQREDKKRGWDSSYEIPELHGDIMDHKAYAKYMHDLDEYYLQNIKVNYHGKMKSLQEVYELQLKDDLEEAGVNLRKLYKQKGLKKKLKKAHKEDLKREEQLKKTLLDLQSKRQKREKKAGLEFDCKKKKKKKKNKKEDGQDFKK